MGTPHQLQVPIVLAPPDSYQLAATVLVSRDRLHIVQVAHQVLMETPAQLQALIVRVHQDLFPQAASAPALLVQCLPVATPRVPRRHLMETTLAPTHHPRQQHPQQQRRKPPRHHRRQHLHYHPHLTPFQLSSPPK